MATTHENSTAAADVITITPNTVLHVNMSNVSKLTATNYLMWSLQVHALLDGYGLAGHLEGSTVAPPPTVTIANTLTENPAFIRWKRQDKLIYSAFIGAILTSIQPTVSQYQSQQPYVKQENKSFKPYLGNCQIYNTQGHSARRCPQLQPAVTTPPHNTLFRPWQLRANMAVSSPYNATNWLLDSGATQHITSDLNNLSLHQPYQGSDDVMIVDGSSLDISHTGSKFFSSSTRDIHL